MSGRRRGVTGDKVDGDGKRVGGVGVVYFGA